MCNIPELFNLILLIISLFNINFRYFFIYVNTKNTSDSVNEIYDHFPKYMQADSSTNNF